MSVILLGLGYLLLAAARRRVLGPRARGLAPRAGSASARRTASLLVAGGLAALAARVGGGVVPRPAGSGIRAGEGGRRTAGQRGGVDRRGDAVVDAAPRRDRCLLGVTPSRRVPSPPPPPRRAPRSSSPLPSGHRSGPAAAVVVVAAVVGTGIVAALVRARGDPADHDDPRFAAGAAVVAVIVGIGRRRVRDRVGAGALQTAGFGPAAAHAHGSGDSASALGSGGRPVTDLTTAPNRTKPPTARPSRSRCALSSRTSSCPRAGRSRPGRSARSPVRRSSPGSATPCPCTSPTSMSTSAPPCTGTATPFRTPSTASPGSRRTRCCPGGDFRAEILMTQPGTYWYHTHQRGSQGVVRGLYGTLVVLPETGADRRRRPDPAGPHLLGHGRAGRERRPRTSGSSRPGDSVRLRLINTDQTPQTFAVQGAPFRVAALDGMDVATDALLDRSLVVAAGGRVDVVLEMPTTPVRVGVASDRSGGIGLVPAAAPTSPRWRFLRRPSIRSPTSSPAPSTRAIRGLAPRRRSTGALTVRGSMSSGR